MKFVRPKKHGLHSIEPKYIRPKRSRKSTPTKKSKYIGLRWCVSLNKWEAMVHYWNRKTHIGFYDNEIEAAKARDAYLVKHNLLKKGRELNFPEDYSDNNISS